MYQQPPSHNNSVGCGLLGCLGGLIAGGVGGALLLVIIAFFVAVMAPDPVYTGNSPAGPELRVTLTEDFLNRYAEQPADGSISINVLPGNQVELTANTTIDAFGVPFPVQLIGLFGVVSNGRTLQVELLNTRVIGIDFDLQDLFSEDLATINQNLQQLAAEISTTLGFPVAVTGSSTTDTEIQIEMTEVR